MTTRRRLALGALIAVLAVGAPLVAAGQPARVARIGVLSSSSAEREQPLLRAFRQSLRELGYVEGRHLVIEPRYTGRGFEKLPELAAELLRLKVDVLVVTGAPAATAARKATSTVPIVMTNVADPVALGLAASLARPGGNVTGLSDFNAGVVAKRLELLKELVPSASRIGVLLNPGNPTNPAQLKLAEAAAAPLHVTLLPAEARAPDDIDPAFTALKTARADAVIMIGDPLLGSHRRRIIEQAARHRLPTIYSTREYVADGGLLAYGTSFEDLYRRAATYVDKILKGASPADLPVEQPTKFELAINAKTARALGLTIPPAVLLRTDLLIQ